MSYVACVPTTIKLNVEQFDELTGQRGWDTDAKRARGLQIDPATISRVRAGTQRPGARFVDRCLATFGPLAYDRLFERSDEEARAKA
jgi:hypothetical protein